MDYKALFKIKNILDHEIQELVGFISEMDEQWNVYKTNKRSIQNLIKSNKNINIDTLNLIKIIIEKHKLSVVFDKSLFARILGVYFLDPNEESKKAVEDLLLPIIQSLDNRMKVCEKNKDELNNQITTYKQLSESLNGLINYKEFSHIKAIGNEILDSLLLYILKIPSDMMSDEEKTEAMYEFNILNVEALKSREMLINKNSGVTTNYTEKPMAKIKFEYDHAIEFEEIETMVEEYQNISSKISDIQKNQIASIAVEFDIELLNQDNINKINDYINNLNAYFDVDFYIKYTNLKNISDWYDLYLKSNDEEEFKSIFEEIESAIDTYQGYIENEESSLETDELIDNNLYFLEEDDKSIVGINWINDDNHAYTFSDYRDLFNGFNKIRHSSREKLITGTYKVKGAGIPKVSEAKFRRLRLGTARIIFIDFNNLIDDKYNEYITDLNPCYVVLNFGQKGGEVDIYKSLNIKESSRIPNIIENFQLFINDSIEKIASSTISEAEKKKQVETFINNLIANNNNLYSELIMTAKGYQNININDGGLKND